MKSIPSVRCAIFSSFDRRYSNRIRYNTQPSFRDLYFAHTLQSCALKQNNTRRFVLNHEIQARCTPTTCSVIKQRQNCKSTYILWACKEVSKSFIIIKLQNCFVIPKREAKHLKNKYRFP